MQPWPCSNARGGSRIGLSSASLLWMMPTSRISNLKSSRCIRPQWIRITPYEVGLDIETSAPYLLQLLGVKEGTETLAALTPEAIKTRTFETLRQMSLHGSQQRPLIIEIEDLHWCDNISEECLAWLVESVAGAVILLLLTYRQGYRPP
jgi:hypothetical protein